MRRLLLVLPFVLLARAGEEPDVVSVYDVADLKTDDAWWAVTVSRVKAAAQGAQVRAERNALVVAAPKEVQEKIATELATLREAFGTFVKIEVRVVRIEGGAGVKSVPADKIDAFLKEKGGKALSAPSLVCRNGQRCCVAVTKDLAHVGDFDVTLDGQGKVIADPVVESVKSGITAKLRPFVAGQTVRVAAEVTVVDLEAQWPEVELPLPLDAPVKVQVPEGRTWSVTRLIGCEAGSYAAVDVGGPWVALVRATAFRLEEPGGQDLPGQEIPLK